MATPINSSSQRRRQLPQPPASAGGNVAELVHADVNFSANAELVDPLGDAATITRFAGAAGLSRSSCGCVFAITGAAAISRVQDCSLCGINW